MVQRYFKLQKYLEHFKGDNIVENLQADELERVDVNDSRRFSMVECIPTPIENLQLQQVLNDLKEIQIGTKLLQSSEFRLCDVRDTFDSLLALFPQLQPYIGPCARIIHSNDFESAVVKVQFLREDQLTEGEKLAISSFLKADDLDATPSIATTELSLMDRINARKKFRMTTTSKYCNLDWIPATSDIVERFFSQAKFVLTDLRKSMSLKVFTKTFGQILIC